MPPVYFRPKILQPSRYANIADAVDAYNGLYPCPVQNEVYNIKISGPESKNVEVMWPCNPKAQPILAVWIRYQGSLPPSEAVLSQKGKALMACDHAVVVPVGVESFADRAGGRGGKVDGGQRNVPAVRTAGTTRQVRSLPSPRSCRPT